MAFRSRLIRSLPCALAAATLILGSCRGDKAPINAAPRSDRLRVHVHTVTREPYRRSVQVVGSLQPREQVTVSSQVPGTVARIAVDLGDRVDARAVLVEIDKRDYELAVGVAEAAQQQAEAQRQQAEASLKRARQLFPEEAISQERLDAVEAQFQVADANVGAARHQLALARDRLDDATIRAPFGATVQHRHVSLGQYVSTGSALLDLATTDRLVFRGEVPGRYASVIRVGQPIELEGEGASPSGLHATVTRIAAGLESGTRSLPIEAEVPNPQGNLIPGTFAHVLVQLDETPAFLIPRSALFQIAGVPRVYVLGEGKVRSTVVEVGDPAGDRIEVLSGIGQGDRVVVSGVDRLGDGSEVDVIETPP